MRIRDRFTHEKKVNKDYEISLRTAAIKHSVGMRQGFCQVEKTVQWTDVCAERNLRFVTQNAIRLHHVTTNRYIFVGHTSSD